MKMGVYDTNPQEYNKKLAEALKNMPEFIQPEWSLYVKSGVSKERPFAERDFWHKRAASILRQIYIRGPVGVGRLRTRYGGRKVRGAKPEEFRKGAGKIIRVILQQAEKAGLIIKAESKKRGRIMSEKGKEFLDSIR